jgi:hypothetical protein
MFFAARSLYNFWGPLERKQHKISNKILGTTVNIYLGKRNHNNLQIKKAEKHHKHHKIQTNILSLNCLPQICSTFSYIFLATESLVAYLKYKNFVIPFSLDSIEGYFSLSSSMVN